MPSPPLLTQHPEIPARFPTGETVFLLAGLQRSVERWHQVIKMIPANAKIGFERMSNPDAPCLRVASHIKGLLGPRILVLKHFLSLLLLTSDSLLLSW